jgi:hypothetical protein
MLTITYICGHIGTLAARDDGGGACHAPLACPQCETRQTVKSLDLFGAVHDTGRSESQLNGWNEPAATKAERGGRTVCICGHGPQFHRLGCCERCSHRHWSHAYQRATAERLFGALG